MAKAKKADAEAEAPEAGAAEGDAAAPKKGFLSKKLIIMAAAALLVLGGGGGGAWFFLFKKEAHEEKPKPVAEKPPAFVDMPEVLVNLSSAANGRAHYLKAKIVLEVTDEKIAEQIKPVMPRVLDSFQTYLREMRSSDLEGSAGLYRVRDELTRRVNLAVAPSRINAVLFKEIVVQ
jgi:flagellar FliL protein